MNQSNMETGQITKEAFDEYLSRLEKIKSGELQVMAITGGGLFVGTQEECEALQAKRMLDIFENGFTSEMGIDDEK